MEIKYLKTNNYPSSLNQQATHKGKNLKKILYPELDHISIVNGVILEGGLMYGLGKILLGREPIKGC